MDILNSHALQDAGDEIVMRAGSEMRQTVDHAATQFAAVLDLAAGLAAGRTITITIKME